MFRIARNRAHRFFWLFLKSFDAILLINDRYTILMGGFNPRLQDRNGDIRIFLVMVTDKKE